MFVAGNNNGVYDMGDRVPMLPRTRLNARLPIPATIRIIHHGAIVSETVDSQVNFEVKQPGAYRLEAWLTVDGEQRPWIYTNPIYVEKHEGPAFQLPPSDLSANVEAVQGIPYVEGAPADANKHKLDIYTPKHKKDFAVLIFIHGGSWRSGDRSNYPALANRFAKEGIGVVVPSYRLMPGAPHPAQVDDAVAAVDWTIRNIAQYGGDPKRIYVSGHSAGGHLAAYAGLVERFWPSLKGVLPLSGVYDVSQVGGFKDDGANASPITHIQHGAPPFLITYCQNDYPALPAQARNFDAALRAQQVSSELVYVPNENHISEIVNVYKDDDATANAILRFIRQHP